METYMKLSWGDDKGMYNIVAKTYMTYVWQYMNISVYK